MFTAGPRRRCNTSSPASRVHLCPSCWDQLPRAVSPSNRHRAVGISPSQIQTNHGNWGRCSQNIARNNSSVWRSLFRHLQLIRCVQLAEAQPLLSQISLTSIFAARTQLGRSWHTCLNCTSHYHCCAEAAILPLLSGSTAEGCAHSPGCLLAKSPNNHHWHTFLSGKQLCLWLGPSSLPEGLWVPDSQAAQHSAPPQPGHSDPNSTGLLLLPNSQVFTLLNPGE